MKPQDLTPEQTLALIEKEFHESNKLWADISKAYADASLKLFDDTIKFVYQALTAMGLIAGFGFAGIQNVTTMWLFIVGEIFMFGSMMFGFYRIKIIYTSNADSVEETSLKIRTVYEKKANILADAMKELQTKGHLVGNTFQKNYEEVNKEISDLFGINKKPTKSKDESWFITWMIMFFSVGFVSLLFAFYEFDRSKDYKIFPNQKANFHRRYK